VADELLPYVAHFDCLEAGGRKSLWPALDGVAGQPNLATPVKLVLTAALAREILPGEHSCC
jgi:hypothetical protein